MTCLRTLVDSSQLFWDKYLPDVVFALNASPSATIAHSPHLLLFGRSLNLPGDAALPKYGNEWKEVREHLADIVSAQNKAAIQARINQVRSQSKTKARYDKKTKLHGIVPGDLVYIHIPHLLTKKTSKKMQAAYAGPFIVLGLSSPYTVKIRRLSDNLDVAPSIHVERLKKVQSTNSVFAKRLIADSDTVFTPALARKPIKLNTPRPVITVKRRGRIGFYKPITAPLHSVCTTIMSYQ